MGMKNGKGSGNFQSLLGNFCNAQCMESIREISFLISTAHFLECVGNRFKILHDLGLYPLTPLVTNHHRNSQDEFAVDMDDVSALLSFMNF